MKLSIITINLNNASGLQKTIESVINQTHTDFEYIVVDGASTDESVEIIKKYEAKIPYWISEPDSGIYNAMNKGIKQAKGEYCLFLNSGDWLYNSKVIEDCMNLDFSDDIVYGYQLKEENGKIGDDICLDVPYISFLTLKKSHIPHQVCFIKRNLFEKIGLYNEENKIISDWEFLMKALFIHNCSIERIPVKITVYDTGGISSIEEYKKHQFEERRAFLEKQFPLIIKDYDYFEAFMQKGYIKAVLQLRKIFNKIIRR